MDTQNKKEEEDFRVAALGLVLVIFGAIACDMRAIFTGLVLIALGVLLFAAEVHNRSERDKE